MIGKNGSEKKPVASAEALEILEERKEQGELGYEQKLAYDHIKKFANVDAATARKLKKELTGLGLLDTTAVKIIEVMPIDLIQLRHILTREKRTIEEEQITKIWELVEKSRGK